MSAQAFIATKQFSCCMYGLSGYARMVADKVRMDAYLEALHRAVVPGSVVVDLGSGPGIFSLFACSYGARRVYAIEPSNSIQLGRDLAAANGYARRIEFIQGLSTKVSLPERVDVVIADLRGLLPYFTQNIPSMIDARERFLAPGGILIPQRDIIWGAVVEIPDFYNENVLVWDAAASGFDMSHARRMSANTFYKIHCKPEQLLAEPCELGFVDYKQVTVSRFEAEPCWTATRSGTAHGLCLWFDATLAAGVCFSNGANSPEAIYGNALFPFPEPVGVVMGQRIKAKIIADLVADDYVWRWNTCFGGQTGFSQSTFFGTPVTLQALKARQVNDAGIQQHGQ